MHTSPPLEALRWIAVAMGALVTPALAQTPTQVAENAVRRIEEQKLEALKLDSLTVYEEVERLRTILAMKKRTSPFPDLTDADALKASGYIGALEARRDAKEPQGSYLWAHWNARICSGFESNAALSDAAKMCWVKTFEGFQTASEGGIARASFSIGRLYENGWGVSRSKFVAADWYVKAAERYLLQDSREGALESVEAALNVVPDLPAAQRIRSQLHK
jgi:TPR repeat protein